MKKLLAILFIGLSSRNALADTKISAMTSSTTLNTQDVIPFVANPSGTATNNIITKTNLSTTLDILTQSSATATYFQNTAVIPIASGGTNTGSTLTGVVRGGASYTASELSGDVTTNASNVATLAATQANIKTFISSITVTNTAGLSLTGPISGSSATFSSTLSVSSNTVLAGTTFYQNANATIGITASTTTIPSVINFQAGMQLSGATGTNGQVLTSAGATAPPTWSTPISTVTITIGVVNMEANETNFSTIDSTASASTLYLVRAYDDTTREYANGFFTVPSNLYTAGTITVRLNGRPKTAAASKNTAWTLDYLPLANGGNIAGAYLTSNSGDLAISGTQGMLDQLLWQLSVSSSTWVANNGVFFRFSRNPSATNDLTGDYYLKSLSLDIPVQ